MVYAPSQKVMMKILQGLIFCFACNIRAQSTGEVLLVQRYQPNKTYTQQTSQATKMQVHFVKMPEGMAGSTPDKVLTLVTVKGKHVLTTSNRNSNGNLHYTAGLEQRITIKVNDEQQKVPGQADLMSFSYKGHFDSLGSVSLDSVINGADNLQQLKTTINNFTKNMQLPNKMVKVGSSISHEVPFSMDQFSGKLMMRYHLDSIAGNKAYFTLDQNMDIDMKIAQMDMKGKAKGPGKMTFLIQEQMVDFMSSELFMDIKSTIGEMVMDMEGKTELTVNMYMK